MAQTFRPVKMFRELIDVTNLAVAVAATGLTTILEELIVSGLSTLGMSIDNANGGAALSAFAVQFKFSKDDAWRTVASAAADFTTPNDPVNSASGDLTSLAANASGTLTLDIRGVYAVRIQATANTNPATVSIYGTASPH